MYRWLTKEEWQRFLKTCSSGVVSDCWEAVRTMCGLMDETAKFVGAALGFSYNAEEAENCMAYLEHVRRLPKDAAEVYEEKNDFNQKQSGFFSCGSYHTLRKTAFAEHPIENSFAKN